jgi:ATP-binding cassette subfamily B protein
VAIVGATGSGKSTVAGLIPRLYDATSGNVLVDGIDVREFPQSELRARIGFVPQSAIIFTGSVRENVAYGRQGVPDEDIYKALDVAQAGFVRDLPEGLDSPISKHGRNLSGGQKQRVCIARAVFKDPPIFVFDDSFSALDYKTDRELRAALKREAAGRTKVIVAQRIGTVMDADRIIVLDRGKVVGDGTHEELLESCPQYREMAEFQLGGGERWRIRGRYGRGRRSPRTCGDPSAGCSPTRGR